VQEKQSSNDGGKPNMAVRKKPPGVDVPGELLTLDVDEWLHPGDQGWKPAYRRWREARRMWADANPGSRLDDFVVRAQDELQARVELEAEYPSPPQGATWIHP
jgi:hypothetical protein